MDINVNDKTSRADRPLTREDVEHLIQKVGSPDKLNLSGQNLEKINLTDFDLSGADLRGADLSEADLRGADLRGVKLNEANLSKADLSGANLNGTNLTDANLQGAKGINTSVTEKVKLYNPLSRKDVTDLLKKIGSTIKLDLSYQILKGIDLTDFDLSGADLSGADLSEAKLNRINLRKTKLVRAFSDHAELMQAILSG